MKWLAAMLLALSLLPALLQLVWRPAGKRRAGPAWDCGLPGLTAEVSNPASAELFEGGVSKGVFSQPQMPLRSVG